MLNLYPGQYGQKEGCNIYGWPEILALAAGQQYENKSIFIKKRISGGEENTTKRL